MPTPLEIEIALHYHARTTDYGKDGGDHNFMAPAVQEALERMVQRELLRHHPGESRDYSPTDGLGLYVKNLMMVSWPSRVWQG